MAAKKASKAKNKKKEIGANKPGEELPPLSPEYQKKYDANKKNIDNNNINNNNNNNKNNTKRNKNTNKKRIR